MAAAIDFLQTDAEKFSNKLIHVGLPVLFKEFQCPWLTHRGYEKKPQEVMQFINSYWKQVFVTAGLGMEGFQKRLKGFYSFTFQNGFLCQNCIYSILWTFKV